MSEAAETVGCCLPGLLWMIQAGFGGLRKLYSSFLGRFRRPARPCTLHVSIISSSRTVPVQHHLQRPRITKYKMRLITWFSSVLLGAASVFAYEAPTELKIDITYSPSECNTKASTGDHIQVHYVCDNFISRKFIE